MKNNILSILSKNFGIYAKMHKLLTSYLSIIFIKTFSACFLIKYELSTIQVYDEFMTNNKRYDIVIVALIGSLKICNFDLIKQTKKHILIGRVWNGGEGEIRTLAPVSRPTPLAGAPLRPTWVLLLADIIKFKMEERGGFEPPDDLHRHRFSRPAL